MPELPEVETIRTQLEKELVGAEVTGVTFDEPKLLLPTPDMVRKALVGAKITAIKRRAKLLIISLSNEKTIVVHLKLTGRLLLRKKDDPKDEWQHVVINLKDGRELRFAELRKFGYLKTVSSKNELEEIEKSLGPEPLQAAFTAQTLTNILKDKKTAVKKVLMDQKNIAGIGNIYADESLFAAQIKPTRPANSLAGGELSKLTDSIKTILKNAIAHHGTSVDAYRDIYGEKGTYTKLQKVYGRAKLPCVACGEPIKKITLGGRGTHFCPQCQK